jgi:hypothetical protein
MTLRSQLRGWIPASRPLSGRCLKELGHQSQAFAFDLEG